MAELNLKPVQTSSFAKVAVSEADSVQGYILSGITTALYQNMRADVAEEKLNLVFTPNDVLTFTQRDAYLKGQLDMLSYLLQLSEESKSSNLKLAV